MVGEIVNISVDERVLDANGKVDVAKAQPITFVRLTIPMWYWGKSLEEHFMME